MTEEQLFEKAKQEVIGGIDRVSSVEEALKFHILLIQLRVKLFQDYYWDMMPHYRGEQNYGWDVRCGIFRPPLKVPDVATGKSLERKAVSEFETAVKINGVIPYLEIYSIMKKMGKNGIYYSKRNMPVSGLL